MKRLILKNLIPIIFAFGISTAITFAQVGIDLDTGEKQYRVSPGIFTPSVFTDLGSFGTMRLIGYIALFFTAFVVLVLFIGLLRSAFYLVTNKSGSWDTVVKQTTAIKHMMGGFGIFFAMLLGYGALSVFLGTGNMFHWLNELGQCGEGGGFLFKAEYKATMVEPKFFDDYKSITTYCCDNGYPSGLNINSGSRKNDGVSYSSNKSIIAVGSEDEGWLFMKGMKYEGSCREFNSRN